MNKKEIQKVVMQDLETMKVVSLLGTETYVKKQEVIDLIDWLDEKELVELPVLPQVVANWLEECKANNYPLVYAISAINSEAGHWLNRGTMESDCINQEKFARAWLDDVYTVEKEPLYYVLDKHRKTMLRKNGLGDIHNSSGADVDTLEVSRLSMYQFTEKEIKGFDERYMAFAAKVEDE